MDAFILGLVIAAALYAVLRTPRLREAFVAREKLFRVLGIVFVAAPVPAIVGWVLLGSENESEAFNLGMVALVGIGVMMLTLPGAAKRMPVLEEVARAAKQEPNDDAPGPRQAGQSIIAPFRHGGAFVRIAGPWIVACWVLLAAPLWKFPDVESMTPDQAANALFWIGAGLLLIFVGIAVVAIAWHRFVIHRELPRFVALPGRSVFPFLWRLWLIGIFFGAADRGADWLTRQTAGLGVEEAPARAVSGWLFTLLVLAASTAFVFTFPAIAEGKKVGFSKVPFIGTSARRVMLGFVLTVLPFLVLGSASSHLFSSKEMHAMLAAVFLGLVLLFAGVAACADYLARAYEALKDGIDLSLAS